MNLRSSLPLPMRRLAFLAIFAQALVLSVTAQTAPERTRRAESMPPPVAEPDNSQAYAPPVRRQDAGPSEADRGPAQKHFVIVSTLDDGSSQEEGPLGHAVPGEKIAIDKRIRVPKVHDVQNDSTYTSADNRALQYEVKYLNWGAVTSEQLRAREGHYFTITWVNGGPTGDFTTRLEYRQVKSKEIVRSLTQNNPKVSGSTRSYFAVVDQAYLAYGPISSWRFTVLRGDTVVAEAKSFVW